MKKLRISSSSQPFEWGKIRGCVALPTDLLKEAASVATEHYRQKEAEEFCGDLVDDLLVPDWLADIPNCIPRSELMALGFERSSTTLRLLATVGVPPHVDDAPGPVAILVLHNDGLKFRQGREAHITSAGEWFVFDEGRLHGVRDTKKTTTYLCLSLPLRAVKRSL